jgi:ribosomal protein S12 methylthiotransferase accessory factor
MESLMGGDARSGGWVEASRLHDGGSSSAPAALCFRDLAPDHGPPLSLGCAAGRTVDAATLSALLELIERDAVALWWRGGRPAGSLQHPEAAGFVQAARGGADDRETWFLDLTTDIGIPVAAAISSDRDGRSIALGFAARAHVADAMAAAFLELAQMELGNRLVVIKADRNGMASLAPAEARHHDRLIALHRDMEHLRGTDGEREHAEIAASTPVERVREMARLLARHGIFAHRVDLTAGDPAIPVVKVVAPLLQAEPAHMETERLARCRKSSGWAQSVVSHIAIL